MDWWMQSNPCPGQLVNDAHVSACVPRNMLAGFQSSGVYPYNNMVFLNVDFAAAAVTVNGKNEQRRILSLIDLLATFPSSEIRPLPKAAPRKASAGNKRWRITKTRHRREYILSKTDKSKWIAYYRDGLPENVQTRLTNQYQRWSRLFLAANRIELRPVWSWAGPRSDTTRRQDMHRYCDAFGSKASRPVRSETVTVNHLFDY